VVKPSNATLTPHDKLPSQASQKSMASQLSSLHGFFWKSWVLVAIVLGILT
jgi:hypothetical protein